MFDQGSGDPLVVIPGIQGRWEWMRPALRALARDRRVISFTLAYVGDAVTAPTFPGLMARRVRLQQETPFHPDCQCIVAPTLVVTGDESLDLVVPVASTREYLQLIPGAQYAVMDRTGHLGMLTQPDRFAGILKEFLASRS